VPLTIIGGFLGSGKTSLVNHILHHSDGRRVAVLVNDFGSINIDAKLIVAVDGETISLANGCVCCTIRDDQWFRQILARRETGRASPCSSRRGNLLRPTDAFGEDAKSKDGHFGLMACK
jgi:Ni2+-binding GTPase involved in maturation of urease and hydrogenase